MAKVVCTSVGRVFSRRQSKLSLIAVSRGCNQTWINKDIHVKTATRILAESEPGWADPGLFIPWQAILSAMSWGAWEFMYADARGLGLETARNAAILSILFDAIQWLFPNVLSLFPLTGALALHAGKTLFSATRRRIFATYMKALVDKRSVALCRDIRGFYLIDTDPRSPTFKNVLIQENGTFWPNMENTSPGEFGGKLGKRVDNYWDEQTWKTMHPDDEEVYTRQEVFSHEAVEGEPWFTTDFPDDVDIIRRYNKDSDAIEIIRTDTNEVIHTYKAHQVVRTTKGWKFLCMVYKKA